MCYPNGVRETYEGSDGADYVATVTRPDGKTPCYIVENRSSEMVLIYTTASNLEVARLRITPTGDRMVTCDGQTQFISKDELLSPSCRELNASDCVPGICR